MGLVVQGRNIPRDLNFFSLIKNRFPGQLSTSTSLLHRIDRHYRRTPRADQPRVQACTGGYFINGSGWLVFIVSDSQCTAPISTVQRRYFSF